MLDRNTFFSAIVVAVTTATITFLVSWGGFRVTVGAVTQDVILLKGFRESTVSRLARMEVKLNVLLEKNGIDPRKIGYAEDP